MNGPIRGCERLFSFGCGCFMFLCFLAACAVAFLVLPQGREAISDARSVVTKAVADLGYKTPTSQPGPPHTGPPSWVVVGGTPAMPAITCRILPMGSGPGAPSAPRWYQCDKDGLGGYLEGAPYRADGRLVVNWTPDQQSGFFGREPVKREGW